MAKRSCIFCNATERLTNEHVIPLWLQGYVGGNKKGGFRGTHISAIGAPLSERLASGNSHTFGSVCARCNNGWMSRLEVDFSRLLPTLENITSPKTFSKSERRTVALWVLKTGIIAHLSSNYRRILPDILPNSMSQGAIVPSSVRIFSAKVNAEKKIRWIQSNIPILKLENSDLSQVENGDKTFVFLISINSLILGFGWHGLDRKKYEIRFLGEAMNSIYPHPKAAKNLSLLDDFMIAHAHVGLFRK